MALADFPRHPVLFGPSPVHRLDRLTAHLGGATVWAKREDCNSALAYGGNKTRKLEYIVPDALAQGADTLVSIGGYQSNHTRQVAAVAAHLGLKAVLVAEKWVDWPDSVNDRVGAPETERAEAFATVISYSGRYTLGEGQVTHHVEVSSVPNWVETDFVRKATIEGDRLTLRTTPVVHGGVEVVAELVWQRVK